MTARSSTGFVNARWTDRGRAGSMSRCCAPAKRGWRGAFRPNRRELPRTCSFRRRRLAFRELTIIRLAVKPELVAGDAFLHGDVVDRLVERNNRNVAHAERDEILHRLVV